DSVSDDLKRSLERAVRHTLARLRLKYNGQPPAQVEAVREEPRSRFLQVGRPGLVDLADLGDVARVRVDVPAPQSCDQDDDEDEGSVVLRLDGASHTSSVLPLLTRRFPARLPPSARLCRSPPA